MKLSEVNVNAGSIGKALSPLLGLFIGGAVLYLGMGFGALAARSVDFLKPLGW